MHRHLIAGALACFGSSLFGQSTDSTANQAQGTLNKVQNTLQNGVQTARDTLDRNVPQTPGSSVSGDGQNRSSLNSQNQIDGNAGNLGNAGVQSNTNLQNNLNRQPGQSNSNLSTQLQGQSTLGGQQRSNGVPQDPTNQYGNTYQANGNNGFQSQAIQGQNQGPYQGQNQYHGQFQGQGHGQPMQDWQSYQGQNSRVTQNNGSMQNGPMTQNAGRVFVLRFDANGREFICVDGRPVYFDNVNAVSAQGNSANQNQYRSGYGNYDSQNGRNAQDPARENSQQTRQQGSGVGQNSVNDGNSLRPADPSNLRDTTNGQLDSKKPDQASSSKSTESKKSQNASGLQTDIDANAEVNKPSVNSTDFTPPKP